MNEPGAATSSTRVEMAVAEYLAAVESGQTPDRDALLRRYADVADELIPFFADHDRMARLAAPLRGALTSGCDPWKVIEAAGTSPLAEGSETTLDRDWPAAQRFEDAASRQAGSRNAPGTHIGEYEILEELGRGGMGVVYRARHVQLNRVVALKMVRSGELASADELERFQAEARAAAALEHPGLVPIFEAGEWQGQPYFAMAFVEGRSLARQLAKGPLPPLIAARLLRKIVAAVVYAHSRGVIHRDLKPANILLAHDTHPTVGDNPSDALESCEPKITDFGLAKCIGARSDLTASGQVLGTPSYMPPEQAAGRVREVGQAADIYALGAILYTMLTGRPPFQSDSAIEVLLQVLESEPTLPRTLRPEIPRELEAICLKCLEKKPLDRYASAADLAADLDRFLNREPPEAGAPTIGQRLRRWIRRQPVLAWHVIGLGAVLLLTQVIFALHPGRDVSYHLKVSGVLALWLVTCVALQGVMNRERPSPWLHYVWSAADALLLTALLSLLVSPLGPLLGGYLVLVCASGLFFQPRLVAFTTVSVMLSYAGLLLLRPEESRLLHYAALFEATLAITGLVIGYQVWRFSVLREYYEDRKQR